MPQKSATDTGPSLAKEIMGLLKEFEPVHRQSLELDRLTGPRVVGADFEVAELNRSYLPALTALIRHGRDLKRRIRRFLASRSGCKDTLRWFERTVYFDSVSEAFSEGSKAHRTSEELEDLADRLGDLTAEGRPSPEPDVDLKRFGEQLQKAITAAHHGQADAAAELKIDPRTLRNWLSEKAIPKKLNLEQAEKYIRKHHPNHDRAINFRTDRK